MTYHGHPSPLIGGMTVLLVSLAAFVAGNVVVWSLCVAAGKQQPPSPHEWP